MHDDVPRHDSRPTTRAVTCASRRRVPPTRPRCASPDLVLLGGREVVSNTCRHAWSILAFRSCLGRGSERSDVAGGVITYSRPGTYPQGPRVSRRHRAPRREDARGTAGSWRYERRQMLARAAVHAPDNRVAHAVAVGAVAGSGHRPSRFIALPGPRGAKASMAETGGGTVAHGVLAGYRPGGHGEEPMPRPGRMSPTTTTR